MCCTVGELGSDCIMAGSSKDSTRGSSSCNKERQEGRGGDIQTVRENPGILQLSEVRKLVIILSLFCKKKGNETRTSCLPNKIITSTVQSLCPTVQPF